MKLRLLLLIVLLLIAAQNSAIAITSPRPEDILRGQVTITGTTDVPSFLSAQLDFKHASDPTETWFAIQALPHPVLDSAFYTWDTTSITDGDYILRLRVNLADGTFQEVTVSIAIQNDTVPSTPTSLPTSTPESLIGSQFPTPFLLALSATPTNPPRPTPTALPPNPAALTQNEIYASLARGALVILGLFIFSAIILRLRHNN